jgi:hypothetical protein
MIVPIESSTSSTSTPSVQEWGLVELNGELVLPHADNDDNDENAAGIVNNELELGCLKFSKDEATPILTLGAHELRGTVEKLKKPFAILKKRKREEADDDAKNASYYEVVGVITKKLLFDQYPKSIMR